MCVGGVPRWAAAVMNPVQPHSAACWKVLVRKALPMFMSRWGGGGRHTWHFLGLMWGINTRLQQQCSWDHETISSVSENHRQRQHDSVNHVPSLGMSTAGRRGYLLGSRVSASPNEQTCRNPVRYEGSSSSQPPCRCILIYTDN